MFEKLRHMTLLLVDDDEFVRDSLILMFESKGCRLRVAETAEEALEILSRCCCDILITDYKLPGMDGLDLCRWLERHQPHCLKVLITAYGSRTVEDEASGIGVDAYIEKPITFGAIESSLARLLH